MNKEALKSVVVEHCFEMFCLRNGLDKKKNQSFLDYIKSVFGTATIERDSLLKLGYRWRVKFDNSEEPAIIGNFYFTYNDCFKVMKKYLTPYLCERISSDKILQDVKRNLRNED